MIDFDKIFDQAWSLMKADVYVSEKGRGGHFGPTGNIDSRYEDDSQEMFAAGREQRFNSHFGMLRKPMITGRYGDRVGRIRNLDEKRNETYDGKTPFEWKDGKMNYLGRDPNFESNTYYRGGSRPRLNADGSFTGINMSSNGFDFENDFEGSTKRFGRIADHENVHQLIEGEIDGWAREQAGLDTAREKATAKKEEMRSKRKETDEDKMWANMFDSEEPPEKTRSRRWSRNSNPVLDTEYQSTPEAKELKDAERRADNLGSIGHETGAYSLDGGGKNFAEIRQFLSDRQDVYPAGAYSDKLSELHTAGPSEDQLRYEKLRQQQEAKQ